MVTPRLNDTVTICEHADFKYNGRRALIRGKVNDTYYSKRSPEKIYEVDFGCDTASDKGGYDLIRAADLSLITKRE